MRWFSITKGLRLWNLRRGIPIVLGALVCQKVGAQSDEKPESVSWRPVPVDGAPDVPEPRREFRGVWVATVYNLDWPSKPGLPVEIQKAELLEILDGAAKANLNAVVLQVRTMCDALYASPIEPWSYYLTGQLGRAPDPLWDPLEFAVEAAHARGLELHAWFNPFRATTAEYGDEVPDHHVSRQMPWVTRASGRHLWLDPSSEFVRNRAITVIFDVVNRYDIDAVHMDDYFYPYPAKGLEPGIDDDENWDRYRLSEEGLTREGGPLDRNEWRRELVNGLIRDLYSDIKRTKPWVKLGISPFGIWRPGFPETIRGMDAYSQIFADSRKWLREGWVDYFSPQLYWKLEGPQSFTALYQWWADENVHGRHIWPGIASSRIGTGGEADGRGVNEVFGQIRATRDYPGKSIGSGQLHWHWEAFITNRGGIRKLITTETYADRAVPPPSPWLAKLAENPGVLPSATGLKVTENEVAPDEEPEADQSDQTEPLKEWRFEWAPEKGSLKSVRWWLVQTGTRPKESGDGDEEREAPEWTWKTAPLVPGDRRSARFESLEGIDALSVRPVDEYGQLGRVRILEKTVPQRDPAG